MGDKYIIELEEKPFHDDNGDFLYRVKGFNSLVFDMTGINKLISYTEPDMEKVREEAFKNGYDAACKDIDIKSKINAAYQKGLSDAWECARKIIHMPEGDLLNIFTECYSAVCTSVQVFLKYDASEAIEKIRQYEQEKEEQDGLRQNIQTIVDQCGYTIDEIAEMVQKMKEAQ